MRLNGTTINWPNTTFFLVSIRYRSFISWYTCLNEYILVSFYKTETAISLETRGSSLLHLYWGHQHIMSFFSLNNYIYCHPIFQEETNEIKYIGITQFPQDIEFSHVSSFCQCSKLEYLLTTLFTQQASNGPVTYKVILNSYTDIKYLNSTKECY